MQIRYDFSKVLTWFRFTQDKDFLNRSVVYCKNKNHHLKQEEVHGGVVMTEHE